ncbi:MAG: histidine phosphatase family protein [Acidimicrobiia bacterium]|nr:histidine phosphatase family protein [Acidimicrobiia bacterium]
MSDAKAVTRLVLVRHGESLATVEQRLRGAATDKGLSELGVTQAERLRDRFRTGHELQVDAIWTSTVRRAAQTAEIVNEAIGVSVTVDPELEEHRPGDADGMSFTEALARFGEPPADAASYQVWLPNGESRADFGLRVGKALHRIVDHHPGQTVLVACHGGVIDTAMRQLLVLPARGHFETWTLNTSLTEFSAEHEPPRHPARWRLVRYNDSAHLAGLPRETARSR